MRCVRVLKQYQQGQGRKAGKVNGEEGRVGGCDAGERRGRNVEQVGGEEDVLSQTLNPQP